MASVINNLSSAEKTQLLSSGIEAVTSSITAIGNALAANTSAGGCSAIIIAGQCSVACGGQNTPFSKEEGTQDSPKE